MFILNLGCAADHYSENLYTLKMKFINPLWCIPLKELHSAIYNYNLLALIKWINLLLEKGCKQQFKKRKPVWVMSILI